MQFLITFQDGHLDRDLSLVASTYSLNTIVLRHTAASRWLGEHRYASLIRNLLCELDKVTQMMAFKLVMLFQVMTLVTVTPGP